MKTQNITGKPLHLILHTPVGSTGGAAKWQTFVKPSIFVGIGDHEGMDRNGASK